jgi:hypothetical protein
MMRALVMRHDSGAVDDLQYSYGLGISGGGLPHVVADLALVGRGFYRGDDLRELIAICGICGVAVKILDVGKQLVG